MLYFPAAEANPFRLVEMSVPSSDITVTLTILLVHDDASCELASHNILLALPTNATSTIAAPDFWNILTQLGVDMNEVRDVNTFQADRASITLSSQRVTEPQKSQELQDLEEQQILAITANHEKLKSLSKEAKELQEIIKNKWVEKRTLDEKLQSTVERIYSLQRQEDHGSGGMRGMECDAHYEELDLFADTE